MLKPNLRKYLNNIDNLSKEVEEAEKELQEKEKELRPIKEKIWELKDKESVAKRNIRKLADEFVKYKIGRELKKEQEIETDNPDVKLFEERVNCNFETREIYLCESYYHEEITYIGWESFDDSFWENKLIQEWTFEEFGKWLQELYEIDDDWSKEIYKKVMGE